MKHCNESEHTLHDYVDGLLTDEERVAFEAHMSECEICRADEVALRDLLGSVSELAEEIQPSRDLWPEIEGSLSGRVVGFPKKRLAALSYVAALAAMVAVVFGLVALRQTETSDTRRISQIVKPIPAETNTNSNIETDLARAEKKYLQAREDLMLSIASNEDQFPPDTLVTVEANLQIIEDAAADIRNALAQHPDDEHLEHMLIATYRSEVNVLQQALTLTGWSRTEF